MKCAMLKKVRYAAAAMIFSLGLAGATAAESVLPFADDFELYDLGTPLIDGTNGWFGSDTNILVQNVEVYEGTQAAQVPLDCLLSNRFDTNATVSITNLWMEFYVQPVHYTGTNDPECETNVASVFYLNSNGFFVLRDSNQWVVASNTLKGAAVTPVASNEWVQLDCWMDYNTKKWFFFQNGTMLRANLGFVDPTIAMLSSMDIYNGSGPTTFVDNVTVSETVPPGLTNSFPTNWAPPVLSITPTNVNLTAFPGQQGMYGTFYVERVSGSDMYFTNTPMESWLSVDVADGVVTGEDIKAVNVMVDSTGFVPGVYTGYVQVAAQDDLTGTPATNSPQYFAVVMTVNPRASVAASAASLQVTTREGVNGSTNVDVWNGSGYYTLDFTTTVATVSGGDWLSVLPVDGSSTGEADKVNLAITCDASSIATNRGSYTGTVTIAGTMFHEGSNYVADASPTVIEVVLNVEYPAPSLGVNPVLLSQQVMHGANASNHTVNVWNANSNYTLVFNASDSVAWITLSPTNGSSTGADVPVTVSYAVGSMAAGIHTGIITIVGTDEKYGEPSLNTPVNVTVIMEIVDPPAPDWISATDGVYTNQVRVQWASLIGVVTCEVWRGESDVIGAATRIASVGGSETMYDDQTTLPGKLYYYWVRGVNMYGYNGAYSPSDSGYQSLLPPATINATKDTYDDKVVVSWSAAPGVPTGYQIWRNVTTGTGTMIGASTTLSYNDTTAVPGTLYYYWVKATNALSTSAAGPFAQGWRRFIAPTNLAATEGTLAGKVDVTWSAVAGATSYEIARDNTSKGTVTGTTYSDTTAAQGVGYNYKVRALSAASTGTYSTAVLGWASLGTPVAVQASQGQYSYKVLVTWPAFSVAMDSYEVQRSETQDFAQHEVLGQTSATTYDDTTAIPGEVYYYRVRGIKGALYWLSSVGSGWRSLAPPTGVTASQGTWPGGVLVQWQAVSGAESYEVWANNENDVLGATKRADVTASNSPSYGDRTVSPGATRYYWIKSKSAGGVSGYSTVASGYAPTTVILGGGGFMPAPGDYDGDGIDDLAVYASTGGQWKVRMSGSGYALVEVTGFGAAGFVAAVGDYDADGLTDPAVYKAASGEWKVWMSGSGYIPVAVAGFGGAGSQAVPSDYDGDGKCDPAVYYNATGNWTVWMSGSGYAAASLPGWGGTAWLPGIGGDADGDGKTDLIIYNPATGTFKGRVSSMGYAEVVMGGMGGVGYAPIDRDYDGDGLTDPSAYNAAAGTWKIWGSSTGYSQQSYTFGGAGWIVAPLDYYGTGRANLCVYEPASGMWWVRPW